MKTSDRVLLFFFSLLAIVAAIVLAYMGACSLLNLNSIFDQIMPLPRGIGYCVLALLLLLCALRFLLHSPKEAKQPASVTLKTTDNGVVKVSLQAINSLVLKCVRGYAQVRECTPTIRCTENQVGVRMRLLLSPDTNIPELTERMQNDVKAYVEKHSGITVHEVLIYVDAPAQTTPSRVE